MKSNCVTKNSLEVSTEHKEHEDDKKSHLKKELVIFPTEKYCQLKTLLNLKINSPPVIF